MAINGRFKVAIGDVFAHGAYLVVSGWSRCRTGQVHPRPAGTSGGQGVIAAPHQPVPPERDGGVPFRPVEFGGLTVTPYLDDKCNRVAYSLHASGMHAPRAAAARPTSHSGLFE